MTSINFGPTLKTLNVSLYWFFERSMSKNYGSHPLATSHILSICFSFKFVNYEKQTKKIYIRMVRSIRKYINRNSPCQTLLMMRRNTFLGKNVTMACGLWLIQILQMSVKSKSQEAIFGFFFSCSIVSQ